GRLEARRPVVLSRAALQSCVLRDGSLRKPPQDVDDGLLHGRSGTNERLLTHRGKRSLPLQPRLPANGRLPPSPLPLPYFGKKPSTLFDDETLTLSAIGRALTMSLKL